METELLHKTKEEDEGHHVNDDTKCVYCKKPLKDWRAMEVCPERRRKEAAKPSQERKET
jgi:hypothetical protein